MSKDKNKKSGKLRRKNKRYQPPATANQSKPGTEDKKATPKRSRLERMRDTLYRDQGGGLVRLALYAPLLIGAWMASGLVLDEVVVFALLTGSITVAHFYAHMLDRDDIPFRANLSMVLHAAHVALIVAGYHLTKNSSFVTCLASVAILTTAEAHLNLTTKLGVICLGGSMVFRSCLYGVLGVLSQAYGQELGYIDIYAVYGFSSGCVLFGYVVLRHLDVLWKAGWRIQKTVTRRDGSSVKRPALISQVYALALMLGVAVPCASIPFGLLPSSFLLIAFGFTFLPKLAQAQFEETTPPEELVLQTALAAAGIAGLTLIAGTLARYGIGL
jgi:hypothetical protein